MDKQVTGEELERRTNKILSDVCDENKKLKRIISDLSKYFYLDSGSGGIEGGYIEGTTVEEICGKEASDSIKGYIDYNEAIKPKYTTCIECGLLFEWLDKEHGDSKNCVHCGTEHFFLDRNHSK